MLRLAAALLARLRLSTVISSKRPPSRIWTLFEGRAMFELGAFYMTRPMLSHLPKGDGHAVQVLPGFMASNSSTVPMRRLLKGLGYDAHGWDSGRNVRVDNALIGRLEARGLAYQSFVMQGRAPQIAMGISPKTLPQYREVADLAGRRIGVLERGTGGVTLEITDQQPSTTAEALLRSSQSGQFEGAVGEGGGELRLEELIPGHSILVEGGRLLQAGAFARRAGIGA